MADDYIDRQKLLKDIEQYHLSDGKFQYWVEVQPSADVPHWIPCSERLPENSRTVLVTDWGITGFGRRFDGRWLDCDGNKLKDVSAWMPLPEPYEDGEQNG